MRKAIFLLAAASLASIPLSTYGQDPATDGFGCTVAGSDVVLEWNYVFFAPIQGYIVARDGAEIASLDSGAKGFTDLAVAPGDHAYTLSVVNWTGEINVMASCTVSVEPSGLSCTVEGKVVHLKWQPLMIDVWVRAFAITRNGTLIATVDGSQFSYDDQVPTVGKYGYKVDAVVGDNVQFPVGFCQVAVDCFGLTAAVDGLKVSLQWANRLPVVDPSAPIHSDPTYFILRDGESIGETKETSFVDTVPAPGEYLYEVLFDLGTGGVRIFLIAACNVLVPGDVLPPPAGLTCVVRDLRANSVPPGPNTVILGWTDPVTYDSILILRDGQELAKLEGTATGYLDIQAPEGVHVYLVIGRKGDQKGESKCEVRVPPTSPAPPKDLLCMLLPPPPTNLDPTVPRGNGQVVLTWTNGDPYDSILVLRDNQVLATLSGGPAGESRTYIDRAPPQGIHSWCVIGLVGDSAGIVSARSAATCCRLTVPPGTFLPPQDLTCTILNVADPNGDATIPPSLLTGVLLEWKDLIVYDRIVIYRNKMVIASLIGTETSFRDKVIGGGIFEYEVCGVLSGVGDPSDASTADARGCADCTVELPPGEVPPPQDFTCSLNDITMSPGDPDIGANGLPPDPAGSVGPFLAVVLGWWNPIRYDKLVISRDKALIATLPGDAMMYRDIAPPAGLHVYGIAGVLTNNRTSPIVTCEIFVGEGVPPVEDLVCGVEEKAAPDTVDLAWKNGAEYTGIVVSRNGVDIVKLPGDATSYKDAGLKPGVYIYRVTGFTSDGRSPPVPCQAIVEGPPAGKLLYFSSGLMANDATLVMPGNRITCLAASDEDVQGWSFGVQSDPKFIVPSKTDLDDTATKAFNGGAGPAFLQVNHLKEGVTMAAVIEDGSNPPAETLPPVRGSKLLNIEYAAGPSLAAGDVYPVQYSSALGSPPVQVLFVVKGFEARPATLPGWVSVTPNPLPKFKRADVDGNGFLEITDPIALLKWLFAGGERPGCMEAADMNGSDEVNIADAVFILYFMYLAGDPPPWPFPDCGAAPAPLGCGDSGSCK